MTNLFLIKINIIRVGIFPLNWFHHALLFRDLRVLHLPPVGPVYKIHQQSNVEFLSMTLYLQCLLLNTWLTLKVPITTAAEDKFFDIFPNFWKKIRYDISWELSASRQFSWNIMPYLLILKKQQNLKLSFAANCRWRFIALYWFNPGKCLDMTKKWLTGT